MGKKHKKHKSEWRSYDAGELGSPGDQCQYYVDKPLEKPLKLVLKVGGSEVTELSGSGHDSSFYEDRSDHERERHKEKKKKKKKKSEKEKDKYLDEDERRRRKEEKKRKREKEQCDSEGETEVFESIRKDIEATDRPVRTCRTHPAENESTPLQQLLEYFLRQLQRKDPNGFFAFPVTDQIAPGYFMIIKNPMDFSTMKEKISQDEYKSVTEFKADFKLMCDNAMTYNRPETVYYKLAKKLLHTGFKMMSKAALLGNEVTTTEEPIPEIIMPTAAEVVKKSKKPSKDMFRVMEEDQSSIFEPEGNACSLTDSTAEEHVLALVEHAADEARDKLNQYFPNCRIGYLKKNTDGTLFYTVVNGDPDNEEDTHLVDLSSLSSKLLPSFTTLGFKEDRRHKVTFLNSTGTALSLQNNTLFTNLKPDQIELMYAGYGDDTGIQCALSLQEFVKDSGSFAKRMVNDLLDQITGGDHSRTIYQIKQMTGSEREGCSNSVLDFMTLKSYSDVSLDMSMLSSLDKVKKELEHEDSHLNLDDASKLLPDFHDVHNDRGGSRPSSSSSMSNNSERDHHLGSPSRISVGEQQDIHDPYEFLQSPETDNQN
ncbi:bromodomain-containing protein 9 isoform X8 [Xenopus laevis]|uniref:Bromodomain-containing protein 9 n=1 Tax=Xenopus laevis TaxID=8355 RepID=A0A8J0VEU1_XENLA|nr:bromodomain-containing protein 9 isoform X8 [Xenopus laevis]